tara:strand:- start:16 stop:480 length:465 start_codon:yes stop_codon:yes gene_type:complete
MNNKTNMVNTENKHFYQVVLDIFKDNHCPSGYSVRNIADQTGKDMTTCRSSLEYLVLNNYLLKKPHRQSTKPVRMIDRYHYITQDMKAARMGTPTNIFSNYSFDKKISAAMHPVQIVDRWKTTNHQYVLRNFIERKRDKTTIPFLVTEKTPKIM